VVDESPILALFFCLVFGFLIGGNFLRGLTLMIAYNVYSAFASIWEFITGKNKRRKKARTGKLQIKKKNDPTSIAIVVGAVIIALTIYQTETYEDRMKTCEGDQSQWTNCKGTVTLPSGAKYVGEFKDGKPHGQGKGTDTEFWPGALDEFVYVGEYKEGLPHGKGSLMVNGVEIYVGEWKDGGIHGQGTLTLATSENFAGIIYSGEFKDDKRHGQGTETWSSGREIECFGEREREPLIKYVGEWKDDKRHGQGTGTWCDGSVNRGIWKDDEFVKSTQ